ncbi:MAG: SDR family oxidoreductase [Campylobacterota bacterium]|nr:SDR family oxidoreductase [Campylobacterota bacterium]
MPIRYILKINSAFGGQNSALVVKRYSRKNMNRKVVITGASSEMGQAIIKKVAKADDQLIVQGYQNSENLRSLKSTYPHCELLSLDFTKSEELEEFCSYLDDVDIFINLSAVTVTDILPAIKESSIDTMLSVNIQALILITQSLIPSMVAKRAGIIVNLSSIAASRGNRGQSVYAGTKGFVESFSRSVASEYGGKGVRINCVAPGPIDAGSLKPLYAQAPKELLQSIVSPKIGSVEDVANMIAFLCGKESEFINGQVLHIDGGFCKGV